MALPCSICSHPQRAEIDKAIIELRLSCRNVAKRFGVGYVPAWRHTRKHLAPLLRAAVKKLDAVPERIVARADRHARRLEARVQRADEEDREVALVKLSAEYRGALRVLGEATRELAPPSLNVLLANFGVRDEGEIRAALELARGSRVLTLDELEADCLAGLRMVLGKKPERLVAILGALGGADATIAEKPPGLPAGATNGGNGVQNHG